MPEKTKNSKMDQRCSKSKQSTKQNVNTSEKECIVLHSGEATGSKVNIDQQTLSFDRSTRLILPLKTCATNNRLVTRAQNRRRTYLAIFLARQSLRQISPIPGKWLILCRGDGQRHNNAVRTITPLNSTLNPSLGLAH